MIGSWNSPAWGLAHARNDPVHSIFSAFFQGLTHRFKALLVRCEVEEAKKDVRESHGTMLVASMFEDYEWRVRARLLRIGSK